MAAGDVWTRSEHGVCPCADALALSAPGLLGVVGTRRWFQPPQGCLPPGPGLPSCAARSAFSTGLTGDGQVSPQRRGRWRRLLRLHSLAVAVGWGCS